MAIETFLKIDGEVKAKGHEGPMVVLDWDCGLGQSGTLHTARTGRGSAGKPSVDDFTIVKPLSKASPALILARAQAHRIPKAALTCRQGRGDQAFSFWVMELTNVMGRTIEIGSDHQPHGRPTETFDLNFARLKVTYTPQSENADAMQSVTTA